MTNVLKTCSIEKLYDLRDYINCSENYDIETKQILMDDITDEIRLRNLEEMMLPIVKEFIAEREEK
ncbi:hypothetical protein VP14_036 [Vibrio phage VPMCC14]|nr:hypothetical protein VP14_036 [Vibrio phage VPMCC14]